MNENQINYFTHMSRRSKFRVWDKLEERYITHDKGYQGHYVLSLNGKFNNLQNGSGGDECVVEQFTGKKDINDIEMYEGDIVDMIYAAQILNGKIHCPPNSFGVYEIFYDDFNAAFYLRCHKNNWFDKSFITEREAKSRTFDPSCPMMPILEQPLGGFGICRVIGNIHQNLELLKAT